MRVAEIATATAGVDVPLAAGRDFEDALFLSARLMERATKTGLELYGRNKCVQR